MRRMLTAALALSLIAGGAVEAKPGKGRDDAERGRPDVSGVTPRGPAWQRVPSGRWGRGQTLPPAYWDGAIDYRSKGLRRPPSGYAWVRVGGDFLLMDTRTGLVLDVVPGR